jgi:hypothetical protein
MAMYDTLLLLLLPPPPPRLGFCEEMKKRKREKEKKRRKTMCESMHMPFSTRKSSHYHNYVLKLASSTFSR